MTSADVVVVGGGPAGLVCALAAARRGLSTVLLEASPSLGGMAASFDVSGQRVDYGSHRFHPTASPPVQRLVHDLLGADLQRRERNGRLRVRQCWVRFPFRLPDLVRSMPPGMVLAAGRDAVVAPFRPARTDSYADVVTAGLGPTALADFHGPMATKLWGTPPERLSGELARRRISVRSHRGLAGRVARTTRSGGRTFLYPRRGYGQIVERIAEEAVVAGAVLRTGAEVRSIRTGPNPAVHLTGAETVEASTVLWTAQPPPAGHAGSPAGRHRALVLAYLAVPVERFTAFDAHYVPDPRVAFSRLSEPKNYRDGPDPGGRTVLCAELPCWPDDDLWTSDTDRIAGLVLDGMGRCGLPPTVPTAVEVRRLRSVYPVLTTDDPHRRSEIVSDDLDGVLMVGRQARLVADNLHHIIDMALSAVATIDDNGCVDRARWQRACARFDTFVVED